MRSPTFHSMCKSSRSSAVRGHPESANIERRMLVILNCKEMCGTFETGKVFNDSYRTYNAIWTNRRILAKRIPGTFEIFRYHSRFIVHK